MLQAIETDTGNPVIPALWTPEERKKWKKEKTFSCPECKKSVILKSGTKVTPHFAHLSAAVCTQQQGGEGEYHENGKLQLYQWLKKQRINVELEAYLPQIQQRPDLFITIQNKKIALEYQCAAISPALFQKRTGKYKAAGITPIWILGGNRQHRAGPNALHLTANDKLFLHQYGPEFTPVLYYYCSTSRKICFFHHIHFTGHRKNYGHLHYMDLKDVLFLTFFKWKQQINWLLEKEWLLERKRLRLLVPSLHQLEMRNWHRWLYERGCHSGTLPSLVGLPVKSQYKLQKPPVVWQSELLFRFLHPFRDGQLIDLSRCKEMLIPSCISSDFFPLIYSPACPVEEYFQLLTDLHFLVKKGDSIFQVRKGITFPESVEAGLRTDQELYRKLSVEKSSHFKFME